MYKLMRHFTRRNAYKKKQQFCIVRRRQKRIIFVHKSGMLMTVLKMQCQTPADVHCSALSVGSLRILR